MDGVIADGFIRQYLEFDVVGQPLAITWIARSPRSTVDTKSHGCCRASRRNGFTPPAIRDTDLGAPSLDRGRCTTTRGCAVAAHPDRACPASTLNPRPGVPSWANLVRTRWVP